MLDIDLLKANKWNLLHPGEKIKSKVGPQIYQTPGDEWVDKGGRSRKRNWEEKEKRPLWVKTIWVAIDRRREGLTSFVLCE